jgi:hypothetical protein
MAYYWLPKSWRRSFESSFLSPKQRKFIDAGERANRYPLRFLSDLYGGGPRSRGAQVVKTKGFHPGKIPGDPPRRSSRAKKIASTPSRKRKSAPQSKLSDKPKRPHKMPKATHSRLQLVGQGHYHGRFKKPRKVIRKQKYPVVQKTENSNTVTDGNCVYLLHTSHPLKYVLKTMCMSMVHKYFEQQGIHIRSFDDVVGRTTGIGTQFAAPLKVQVVYQGNPQATANPTWVTVADISGTGAATYTDLSILLADGLINLYDATAGNKDLFIHQIRWLVDGATATASSLMNLSTRFWDATEVRIAISGKSMCNIQNRTLAGDVADTALTTSIYANPLHGKHYSFKGNGARMKNLGEAVINTSGQFAPNQATGVVEVGALGTTFGAVAQDVLAQPPSGNYFYNCSKTSYIRLEPGSIKQSTCYAEVTKSFNQWLRGMYNYLETSSTLGGLDTFFSSSLGVSRMVALEKVADMGSGNDIALGYERDGIMRAKCWFRKRRHTAASNDSTL